MKTVIIIPCYNEALNILSVAKELSAYPYDILVINDGSLDNTYNVCIENNIPVVNLPINLGIGGAVQTGYIYAQDNHYDCAVQFDGDGQHDASYIAALLYEIAKGCNLVIGSRFLDKGELSSNGYKSTFMRRIGIRFFSQLIKLLTGKKVIDATSGFRAADKVAIAYFASEYPVDYPEPESIVSVLRIGLNVSEVAVKMKARLGGVSSISTFKSLHYMVKVSLAILFASLAVKKNGGGGNIQ